MVAELQMNLGRRQEHDPASKLYPFMTAEDAKPLSVSWAHFGSASDQNGYGGCVGWTGMDWRNCKPNKIAGAQYHDADGLEYYNGATRFDQWDTNDRGPGLKGKDPDEGSSGLGLAKYFKSIGVIDPEYRWAFTLGQFVLGFQEGPWACGFRWTNDMFEPDEYGRIKPTGGEAGGHELLAVKLDYRYKEPMDSRVWLLNHWTRRWGINGRAWLTLRDFDALRRDGGDCLMMKRFGR